MRCRLNPRFARLVEHLVPPAMGRDLSFPRSNSGAAITLTSAGAIALYMAKLLGKSCESLSLWEPRHALYERACVTESPPASTGLTGQLLHFALRHYTFRHCPLGGCIDANTRNTAVTNFLERLDDPLADQRQDGDGGEHARRDECQRAAALREDPHDSERQDPP